MPPGGRPDECASVPAQIGENFSSAFEMHAGGCMNVADPILAEPLRPVGGMITPSARPGIGLVWDDTAVARYRVA
jgi:hypothetical protein